MEHLIEPEFFSFFNSTIKKVLASLYGSSSCKNWKIERTFIGNIFPSSNLDLKTLSLLSSGYQKAMQNETTSDISDFDSKRFFFLAVFFFFFDRYFILTEMDEKLDSFEDTQATDNE